MSETETKDVLREWDESASYWRKHGPTICSMFAPVTCALIGEAGIVEGKVVLDVAGGPGEPSLTISKIVGPTGSVTCTDAVAAMVAAAKSEARRRRLTNITFRQCLADSLPFEDNSFDVTVSRLGAMFFPNPLTALREMLRVTKPGGAISLVVWDKNELNPFMYLVSQVMSCYIEMPPANPEAPGAFRFAERGNLARILADAGATEVREQPLTFRIEAPISAEEFWLMRSETSGTLREKLATLSAEKARRAGLEVQEAVRGFFPNQQMTFPAQMIVVTGTKG